MMRMVTKRCHGGTVLSTGAGRGRVCMAAESSTHTCNSMHPRGFCL